jgi:hypothetical protein
MTTIDPTRIPLDQLLDMLASWAAGYNADEAALGLLATACDGIWLRRRDFLSTCVEAEADGWTAPGPDGAEYAETAAGMPVAAIRWEDIPAFLARGVPASTGEVNILRAAASIMGIPAGSLREITASLDADNLALLLDAIAHRAGWHDHIRSHTVTGRLTLRPATADRR